MTKIATPEAVTAANKYILHAIHAWVWSGFYSPAEVDAMIDDVLEDGADEKMLRAAVLPEFDRKRQAEKNWPAVTDFDRLALVFTTLAKRGVLCLHNAGYTMSDGHGDASDALSRYPAKQFSGYCFYHGQDVERALEQQGLMLAFESLQDSDAARVKVGVAVKGALENAGFEVLWDGTSKQRIEIPAFDWKHRNKP